MLSRSIKILTKIELTNNNLISTVPCDLEKNDMEHKTQRVSLLADFGLYSLTPIWGILGTSGSVISGQKIQRELLYQDLGIFLKNLILGTELASFSDKKTRPHSIAL